MAEKQELAPPQGRTARNPFALLGQMTSELDRVFEHPSAAFRWPLFRRPLAEDMWAPEIDMFERENRLVRSKKAQSPRRVRRRRGRQ